MTSITIIILEQPTVTQLALLRLIMLKLSNLLQADVAFKHLTDVFEYNYLKQITAQLNFPTHF